MMTPLRASGDGRLGAILLGVWVTTICIQDVL